MNKYTCLILLALLFTNLNAQDPPNILLIIADDMGADVMSGYGIGTNMPVTPNLDKLRQSGLRFSNLWATPVCSATRASIMTGKYGVNNGVSTVPGVLSTDHTSIFKQLNQQDPNYTTCLVGKWHLGRAKDYDHPNEHGVDEFMGVLEAGVSDYYKWNKVEDQTVDSCHEYATSYFTNFAADWINKQKQPWMMWLAHVSPHAPYHFPPDGTFTRGKTGTKNMKQYLSMIENLDYEIGRLLDSIPDSVLENTLIIFVGDNGTPVNIVQGYSHGKGSLYQGGIHVPMLISGKGVSRKNETEDAMINVCDLYATIAHFSDDSIGKKGGFYNSLSFKHLLSDTIGYTRRFNYMELGKKDGFPNDAYTIRDSQYKMIQYVDSTQEFYDLINDPFETTDLLKVGLSSAQRKIMATLEQEAHTIRTGWSCNDGIQNGEEAAIDCGGACSSCQTSFIDVLSMEKEPLLYPNPFDDQIIIEFRVQNQQRKIEVFNAVGQKVEEISNLSENKLTIATENYSPGMYYVSVTDLENRSKRIYKLIKK